MTEQIKSYRDLRVYQAAFELQQEIFYEAHFVSKLTDSDAEQAETQHWLDTALDCKYIKPEIHAGLLEKCDERSAACSAP